MKIFKYPDGSSYVDIKNTNYTNFTFKINTYEDLWHLGQIIETANFNCVKPVVTIPYLIDAQADKRFSNTQSSGLKMVCKFLNEFDVLKYRIFHPHNPDVLEALLNNVEIIDNSEFIIKVLNRIDVNNENLILASVDAGGFKPLIKLCDKINWKGETYSASKSRSWNIENGSKLIQQIDRVDFNGKDLMLVDDICVYGGTFKGLSKLFRERNVSKLYLAISHMTVQNLGDDSVMGYFDKIFTTNSKYDNYFGNDLLEFVDLEVIKLF